MNKDLKDFQDWIKKMQDDADDWVIYLVYQSKKKWQNLFRCNAVAE